MNVLLFFFIVLVFMVLVELLGILLTLGASLFIIWFVNVNYGANAAQAAALILVVILVVSSIPSRR